MTDSKHITQISTIIEKFSVVRKWHANCIVTSILLHESLTALNIKNELIAGFLCFDAKPESGGIWHCWVAIDDGVVDVATTITRKLFPDQMKILDKKTAISRHQELPDDYERWDLNSTDNMKQYIENVRMYNLYMESPVTFWNTMVRKDSNHLDRIIPLKQELNGYIRKAQQS
jgi:hypothetical protein